MKTPLQEVFAHLRASKEDDSLGAVMTARLVGYAVDWLLENEKSLLEKEKEVMCEFQDLAQRSDFWVEYDGAEGCFDKTFKTKDNGKLD